MWELILVLFQEAQELTIEDVKTPIYEVAEQAAVEGSFPKDADELLNVRTYRLAVSQDFKQDLVYEMLKSPTLPTPERGFAKEQSERAVTNEEKFRLEKIRPVTVKQAVTLPSPLTGRYKNSSKTSEDDESEQIIKKFLLSTILGHQFSQRAGQAGTQTTVNSTNLINTQKSCKFYSWWMLTSPTHWNSRTTAVRSRFENKTATRQAN